MLKLDGVAFSYANAKQKSQVFKEFSLDIPQGKILAVLGRSGCGKSTLIQLLAQMFPLELGRIYWDNEGEIPLSAKTDTIAVIPQNHGLLAWKTLRQNCLLPMKLRKQKITAETLARLEKLSADLQLSDLLNRYPKALSGGQAQRGALVRAFLTAPDLLLMDEAFSALDAITRVEAWALFLQVWSQSTPTTVLVTHSIEEALFLGHEVVVLGNCGNHSNHGNHANILYQAENPFFSRHNIESNENYAQIKNTLLQMLSDNREKTSQKEGGF